LTGANAIFDMPWKHFGPFAASLDSTNNNYPNITAGRQIME
jgi:hypothetical protein